MPWLQLSVRVPRERAPLVESLLSGQGAQSVTLQDDGDHPVLEPGVAETPLWPRIRVQALFSGDANLESLQRVLALVPGLERPQQVTFETLDDRDWERAWLDRFRPMRFGRRLWIVPGGQDAPEPDAVNLHLDPGLAFGTGTHPTTRLCLGWLDGWPLEGREVLDYGCGSGVLGIAAVLLGATRATCVDHDPQALSATRENADRNGVAARVRALAPMDDGIDPADVVLANILAAPLIELAPRLQALLLPGGALVLSGILAHQANDVAAAYAELGEPERCEDDGWTRLAWPGEAA